MTVRDEVELLRDNLLYHRHLGVDTAYVYDDGSTDGSPQSVADLDFVRVGPTVDARSLADEEPAATPEELERYVTSRQNLNTVDAMRRARADGAEWLLAIDADELACVDLRYQAPGALRTALDGVPSQIEAVIMPPLEILQRHEENPDVMARETLFKSAARARSRRTYDPFTGRRPRVPAVYGHDAGKSAIRLAADLMPTSVHRFRRRDGSRPPTRELGWLLHYYCHSFEAFESKFRRISDHPDRHLRGQPVPLQKRLWRDVVNRSGMSEQELRDYYRRWVLFDDAAIRELRGGRRFGVLPQQDAVVEVLSARQTFADLRGQALD